MKKTLLPLALLPLAAFGAAPAAHTYRIARVVAKVHRQGIHRGIEVLHAGHQGVVGVQALVQAVHPDFSGDELGVASNSPQPEAVRAGGGHHTRRRYCHARVRIDFVDGQ